MGRRRMVGVRRGSSGKLLLATSAAVASARLGRLRLAGRAHHAAAMQGGEIRGVSARSWRPTRVGFGAVDQSIAGTPHSLDVASPERSIHLAAQRTDVLVDDVAGRVVSEVPDMLQYVGAGQHLTPAPHQQLEQRELLGRQVDLGPSSTNSPGTWVKPQVASL